MLFWNNADTNSNLVTFLIESVCMCLYRKIIISHQASFSRHQNSKELVLLHFICFVNYEKTNRNTKKLRTVQVLDDLSLLGFHLGSKPHGRNTATKA